MLNDERVKDLWRTASPLANWEHWQKNYQELLVKVRNLSDDELAWPKNQELLWSADAITTLGPGGKVPVRGAFTDPVVTWKPEQGEARWLCLDAKYRSEASQVADAFTSAHIYRDSLRWDGFGKEGRCAGAVLLVPAMEPKGKHW